MREGADGRLDESCRLPGGLRALALKVEGWHSAAENDLFPFPLELLREDLGTWASIVITDPNDLERVNMLLARYEAQIRPDDRFSLAERLCATLCEIDRMISQEVRPVFEDQGFLKCERTWRGLRQLVGAAGESAEVRMLEPGDHGQPVNRLLRRLREFLTQPPENPDVPALLVLDYVFDRPGPGLRSVARALDLTGGMNVRVICAASPEAAGGVRGDLVLAQPAIRDIAGRDVAEKLILVTARQTVRPEYAGTSRHPAEFVFNRGCAASPALAGPAVYATAAALANAPHVLANHSAPEERCRAASLPLNRQGFECGLLGRAMIVWNREEA